MAQQQNAEFVLTKMNEYARLKEDELLISHAYDYFLFNKKKNYSSFHESIMELFLKHAIKKQKYVEIKEALIFYRSVTQSKLELFVNMLNVTKEMTEEEINKIKENFSELDLIDLESDDSPDKYLEIACSDFTLSPKEEIIQLLKFSWMIYKLLLDFTKVNNKLLDYYFKILKSTFNFCKKYNLKNEFKRLTDSVRGYLQTLIKSKNSNVPNKIDINNPEVIKSLIQIRISVLETSVELSQWQEAFKTAEDIIFLVYKINDFQIKLPDKFNFDYFSSLAKLFKHCGYHLYHGYALMSLRSLYLKLQKTAISKKNEENLKTYNNLIKTIEDYSITSIDESIILSFILSKNDDKKFIRLGNEVIEGLNDRDYESNERLMNILKLNFYPTENYLEGFIRTHITTELPMSNSVNSLYTIYTQLKSNFCFTKIKTIIKIINELEVSLEEKTLLKKVVVLLSLNKLHTIYSNVTFNRISHIYDLSYYQVEDLIIEASRQETIKVKIDQVNKLVHFYNPTKPKLENLIFKLGNVVESIQKDKVKSFQNKLKEEIKIESDNGLILTNQKIEQMDIQNDKCELKLKQRKFVIYDKINENINNDEKEKERKEKEIYDLKIKEHEQREQKEIDTKLKFYLLEKLQEFTNTIVVDQDFNRVKYKLSDLVKDHEKITSELLVQAYLEEEENFKKKNKNILKGIFKSIDYEARAKKRVDMQIFKAKKLLEEEMMIKELNTLNENQENFSKKIDNNEKLINDWIQNNVYSPLQNDFDNYINVRKQYFADKEKSIIDYLFNKVIVLSEEMRVEYEKEEEKKGLINNLRKKKDDKQYKKGENFNDNKTEVKNIDWNRSANAITNTTEPQKSNETKEFARSQQFSKEVDQQPKIMDNSKAFIRSANADTSKTNISQNTTGPMEFKRSANAGTSNNNNLSNVESDSKPIFFNKAKETDKKETQTLEPPKFTPSVKTEQPSTGGFVRQGINTQTSTTTTNPNTFTSRDPTTQKTTTSTQQAPIVRGGGVKKEEPKPKEEPKQKPKEEPKSTGWRK